MEGVKVKKKRVVPPSVKMLAFWEGLGLGLEPDAAGKAAGYKRSGGWAYKMAAREDVAARVKEIRLNRAWGGSRDLAPVINAMRDLALGEHTAKSAAAMKEARELLVEVARLKGLLPQTQARQTRAPGLPDDEWLAKYAPKP